MSERLARQRSWTNRDRVALGVVFLVGLAIRAVLLPTEGLRDDLDQFVGWVHHVATNGLGALYEGTAAGPVTFGPVMAYVWALLAAVEPGFRTTVDASDAWIRTLMKLPAVIADVGLASVVVYALRVRPAVALLAGIAIFLHPGAIDVSAWWGQYESVFALVGLTATVLAIRGRLEWAAVFLAIAVSTKPQALPFLVPIAAWIFASAGWWGLIRVGVVSLVTTVVLWAPFLPYGGPLDYVANLTTYQSDIFNMLSLRAWNVWWLVQEAFGGGAFIGDDVPFLGPITLRHLGYGLAGGLQLAIAYAVVRDPRPRTLILGLAASVLTVFAFATQMHERYAYAALVFLALLIDEPRMRVLAAVFAAAFTLNLLAAVPPTADIAAALPVSGPLGVIGSLAILGVTYGAMRGLVGARPDPVESPAVRAP